MRSLLKELGPLALFFAWSLGFYLFHALSSLGSAFSLGLLFLDRRITLAFVLGWCFGWLSWPQTSATDFDSVNLKNARISVIVDDLRPVYTKGVLVGTGLSNLGKIRFKLPILGWTGIDKISAGSKIQGLARCSHLSTTLNPFDHRFQLKIQGIKLSCVFASYSIIPKQSVRQTLISRLDKKLDGLPNFLGVKSLLLTFSLGKLELLPRSKELVFRETGLFHLLVLSGYQLMVLWFIGSQITAFLRYKLGFRGHTSFIFCKLLCFVLIALYSVIVGIDKPILRALAFIFLAELIGPTRALNPMLGSAYIVCLVEPGAQFTLSFLLTFSALLGFSLASGYSGLAYIVASSALASVFSGLVMWLFGYDPNGGWVLFNLIFGPLLSTISTAGGILGIAEYLTIDSIVVWWLVSLATSGLYKAISVLNDYSFFSFSFEYALVVALAITLVGAYRRRSFLYARYRFRRQRQKMRSYTVVKNRAFSPFIAE